MCPQIPLRTQKAPMMTFELVHQLLDVDGPMAPPGILLGDAIVNNTPIQAATTVCNIGGVVCLKSI